MACTYYLNLLFINAIGHHMGNAGLDDVWVESGAFAQNSTSAMGRGP